MDNVLRQEQLCDGFATVGEICLFSPTSHCWISRATVLQIWQEGSLHRSRRTLPFWGSHPWLKGLRWKPLMMGDISLLGRMWPRDYCLSPQVLVLGLCTICKLRSFWKPLILRPLRYPCHDTQHLPGIRPTL